MSDPDAGFGRRPRTTAPEDHASHRRRDIDNVIGELDRILDRLGTRVRNVPRAEFVDGSDAYDAASMSVVRMHGILERRENSALLDVLSETERRALATVRNIITHGGYANMNDDSFWETATTHLPELVRRLRSAAVAERDATKAE